MLPLLIISTLVKCLLIPAYRSTDFEVHRNWLAITSSLPISQWYLEATFKWTLDYPPFFAWFEKLLGMVGQWVDPGMVELSALGYSSPATVVYQRLTVMVSELVLYWALQHYLKTSTTHTRISDRIVAASIFFILDSGSSIIYISNTMVCSMGSCFIPLSKRSRFVRLGGAVLLVFGVSLGPFVWTGQASALVARLFPFTRGLCHAYWAPNLWALYAGADRCLILVAKKLGWALDTSALGSMTRGYVGDTVFAVLPTVEAIHTLILTIVMQLLVLQVLWRQPTFDHFVSSLTLCGFASYLFGWHVHEKAIMLVLIPYSLMATKSVFHLRLFVILSSAGIMSLYPLLFHIQETPLKYLITVIWYLCILPGLCYCLQTKLRRLLTQVEMIYVMGLILMQAYTSIGHSLVFGDDRLEFLPLMMTSVYCAVGIMYAWLMLMYDHLTTQSQQK
ncbi:unnamed protein product [Absidia cylindrospora]